MSGAIAQYWASLGFRIDRKELRKVDTTLKQIEDKLRRFGKKIDRHLRINFDVNKFTVDQKRLNLTLGNALDLASTRLVFQVNKFDINQTRLNTQMAAAVGRASRLASAKVNPDVNVRERLPRETLRRRDAVAAGGIGGLAARMYTPALGLALGGYGLGQVNRRNQEVISAQLTTQAVLEASGLVGQGPQAFEWLRSQGNRIGFNYLDASQDYNNFLSNSLGAGQSLQESQDIYLGFSEYQRAMGITSARQKLVMNALSQMQGKGVLSMEELRRQMAESLPGTMSIFAQAYQEMTGGSLSGQESIAALMNAVPTGKVQSSQILPIVARIMRERAAPKLDVAMKTSQAEQARFQNMMSDQAIRASAAGVESGFARLFRSLTIAIKEASPIVESMARGFDSMSLTISRAILSIQSIQRAFQARDSVFADIFGKDTVSNLKDFFSGMGELSKELGKLGTTISEGWGGLLPIIITLANKTKDIFLYSFKMLNALLPGGEGIGAAANYGRAMTASLSGASPEEVAAIAAGKDFVPDITNPVEEAFRINQQYANLPEVSNPLEWLAKRNEQSKLHKAYIAARKAAIMDSSSIYYNDPVGFDQMLKDRQMAMDDAALASKGVINTVTSPGRVGANTILSTFTDRRIPVPFENTDSQLDWATRYKAEQAKLAAENFNKYDLPGINKPLAQGQSSTNLEIKMDVSIQAANPEDFNQQFQEKFKSVIQDTLIQYSQKE